MLSRILLCTPQMFLTCANVPVTRSNARNPKLFHLFGCCIATADKPVFFLHFFCAMFTWADAKGFRHGPGAELWRLSVSLLSAGFSASTYSPSLGSDPFRTVKGLFLLLFLPLLLLFHLSRSFLLEFQMEAY